MRCRPSLPPRSPSSAACCRGGGLPAATATREALADAALHAIAAPLPPLRAAPWRAHYTPPLPAPQAPPTCCFLAPSSPVKALPPLFCSLPHALPGVPRPPPRPALPLRGRPWWWPRRERRRRVAGLCVWRGAGSSGSGGRCRRWRRDRGYGRGARVAVDYAQATLVVAGLPSSCRTHGCPLGAAALSPSSRSRRGCRRARRRPRHARSRTADADGEGRSPCRRPPMGPRTAAAESSCVPCQGASQRGVNSQSDVSYLSKAGNGKKMPAGSLRWLACLLAFASMSRLLPCLSSDSSW